MDGNLNEAILKVRNLNYKYNNEKIVLSNINIDIYEGEKVAILGSNGAGKSTFFLNINGVLTPKSGDIIYRGKKISKKELNELRKNIGIVFQDADNQIIASTVLAEVSFGPMNLKLPKEEVKERVEEALSYMNLTEFKSRPPHYLSGGEKKRVSIADIIAMQSEIIIFDEPTASLDPLNAIMLEEVLKKLSEEKKTLLISTHDVDFAYRWAERVIVFANGEIIADGTPLQIFKDDKIIKCANLKRPTMLDIYEILLDKGLIDNNSIYPKDIVEFTKML
ncbi:energy-coupling factor ABC transporter ATP-binding protein [Clostridium botulinum]|uniref:energy-coupling factor ABC transporter ATP-binding protein n=1 Tax=Clostridium botulinum TaxID=1491 RepID=UPI0007740F49|nr:energy-coupling factor ABC transporter ATP-binding protein [Clostridium botulinum]MBY6809892.1 energy-coupling factor ABC transporter ATP-binding protein [Clostridium botulinum]MBY6823075.1 energy-coupling factor ABC transporter ATP-binding protein [Clostridium botulinum]MBY6833945.1 energy-coupling factor ABC transporter ATP-binding protein [Clostridium botulinum]MBY6930483.1 energy-coupling factor ABC transporter ATP-binding protein [Clostridium botulinum]MBY6972007.1 energy-coupling fact